MEKRLLLAIVLSMAVLLIYPRLVSGPKPSGPDAGQGETDQSQTSGGSQDPNSNEGNGESAGNSGDPGSGAGAQPEPDSQVPEVEDVVLENSVLRVQFTQVGASIRQAWLLDQYPTAAAGETGDEPLQILMPSDHGLNSMRLEDLETGRAELGARRWRVSARDGQRSVTYETSYTEGKGELAITYHLKKVFRLPKGKSRHLQVEISWRYEGETTPSGEFLVLVSGGVFQDIGGELTNPPKSAIYPIEDDVSVHTLSDIRSSEEERLETSRSVRDVGILGTLRGRRPSATGGFAKSLFGAHRYVADCSNYFGAFFVLTDFPGRVTARVNAVGLGATGTLESWEQGYVGPRTATSVAVEKSDAARGVDQTWKGLLYLGPVDDARIDEALESVLPEEQREAMGLVYQDQLGFVRSIARVILAALSALHGLVGNWGFAIILLTLCVRLLLFPLNRKSQTSMLRMQEAHARIKPKLDALKEKHKDDAKQLAAEQMALFRKEKVPMVPLGGCLPIFLQMPIFFGLFSGLRASIDLRQADWWWVADLSQPDRLIALSDPIPNPMSFCCIPQAGVIDGLNLLPILMTVAWIANSLSMPRPENMNPQMEQQRKIMLFMPILFGFFMYGYAAGLSLYWLTSSLIGIIESRVIKKLMPLKKD